MRRLNVVLLFRFVFMVDVEWQRTTRVVSEALLYNNWELSVCAEQDKSPVFYTDADIVLILLVA